MSIFDWSKTASSNGNSDAAINFQEGQAPSTVNDSARALMARIAYWRDWFTGNVTQGGSSNAYTITSGESLSAYTAGMRFLWKPNADSTGAVTLNVDAIGAKKVYLPIGTQAVSGSIDADAVYDVIYQTALDSSNGGFKIVGGTLDADLETLAGLTVAADNFIVGNSGGTAWEVKTPEQARTSIGLPLGTSGATVPLLNGTNTWSALQTHTAADEVTNTHRISNSGSSRRLHLYAGKVGSQNGNLDLDAQDGNNVNIQTSGTTRLVVNSSSIAFNSNTVWHAGNDGAGSGLDADTLDGVQESALAKLAGAAFTGQSSVTAATSLPMNFTRSGSAGGVGHRYTNTAGHIDAFWTPTGTNTGSFIPGADNSIDLGTAALSWKDLHVQGVMYGGRQAASTETTGTLTAASANRTIQLTGNPTINNSVFAAGDIIVMYAGASARTITAGTITTMRLDGTATTGSRTLAARGMAMLFFVSATEVIVAGGAVT